MGAYEAALARLLEGTGTGGWADLPFMGDGTALALVRHLDSLVAEGRQILPAPNAIFSAMALTPRDQVKVVILGQDPYPTPGDANGLAFSYVGIGRLPASLQRIFRELVDDLGLPRPSTGDLSAWARQGALLLNTALSVEAGRAGAHLRLGWDRLANEALAAISRERPPTVFILWGDKARARKGLIDARHLVIESAHPSPLAARGDFLGSRPFSRANAFLAAQGEAPIDWSLP